jgi:hypothetical protein
MQLTPFLLVSMYLSYCIHITIVDHFAEKLSQNPEKAHGMIDK